MSVRKRVWKTQNGERREAWVVAYTDRDGIRRIATFARKREADLYEVQVRTEVRAGVHTPPSDSLTVEEAAAMWLAAVQLEGRERATLKRYDELARLHVNVHLGPIKLAQLTTPRVHAFRDALLARLSRAQARKVLWCLKAIIDDAMKRGCVAQNVARSVSVGADSKRGTRLQVGVDIPSPDEIRRILNAATDAARAILMTLAFTGLRSSELRGLRWSDVDLKGSVLHVRQRADQYCAIGAPKSASGERAIPLGPIVANTLREWRLACPRGEFVFLSRTGRLQHHKNIVRKVAHVFVRAGVMDAEGRPKYTGLHSLRHFYASWCINRRVDGGLELPAKVVQERLGHSSIVMTLDTYGHLFPRGDDGGELAAAERALFAPTGL